MYHVIQNHVIILQGLRNWASGPSPTRTSHTPPLDCLLPWQQTRALMSDDQEEYVAVLKASFDYTPQSEDEIEIKEDQLLLLIEKADDECVSSHPSQRIPDLV